ncbi:type II toxin-antitoxin system RatA family toxin [Candidatus Vondammii sp. HM_W22]|uniref:type II toxin-antitoxin system RatA family toxin n=1 Tax=Candidatus Vondammii sp. HM_W22 TaxID=2687299 RepID=UPI001F145DB6|nr:type II toxin-antitoxin system RatA family toxin [Candidatus Vondammii sp. HM_W22]
MPVVHKSALVAHSTEQMFDLINDVESYPQFLPWCHSTRLLSQTDDLLCGELEVARVGIKQKFSTCNRLFPHEKIEIELREGPFKQFRGEWRLQALSETASKIELELDFSFSGKLIDKAFSAVFSQIANTLVDSFCKRADEVYGGK